MSDEKSQDERVIFHAALALSDVQERRALLRRACGEDSEMQVRIEALLAAHARDELLNVPAMEREKQFTTNNPKDEQEGSKIGRYKLLQQIGEGGFGMVYMAEQQEPMHRKVALKIIKAGMDTKQVIARFEAERQALALMDHPNIARILDAGETNTGRPYFVMDLVRGTPITEFCDDRNLPTGNRLQIFVQVCLAVHHAHQKGIIHRDIKPSNILVSNNGDQTVPVVIDFGIAKATQGRLTDKTLFTQFQQFIGTPAYMSPEQAQMSSVDVDTRGDIYSLGVLLYELITGTTPLDPVILKSARLDEICRRVREEEAISPSKRLSSLTDDELKTVATSRQTDPSSLPSLLRGELDWIAMKAVEKDRSRRYSSADALANDVNRYLRGDPVLAVPPSSLYLAQKFVRRNHRLLIAIGAISATLLIATVVSTWLAITKSRLSTTLASEVVAKEAAIRDAEQKAEELANQLTATRSARREAEQNAFFSDMHLASEAYNNARVRDALQILDRYEDIRSDSFEWKCLKWLCDSGESIATIRDHQDEVVGIAVSKQGLIASFSSASSIRLHDLNSRKQIDSWQHPCRLTCMEFTEDGQTLALGDTEGNLHFWRVTPRRWLKTISILSDAEDKDKQALNDIAFSADSSVIAIGTGISCELWDWEREQKLKQFPYGTRHIGLTENRLGRGRVGGGTVFAISDLATGDELGVVSASHTSSLTGIRFSPQGKYLATCSWDSVIRLWDVKQVSAVGEQEYGQPLSTLRGHRLGARQLDFSPDGRYLASASSDATVRLWRGKPPLDGTEVPVATLRGHTQQVNDLAFSADGKVIVSCSADKTIKIWPGTPTAGRNVLEGHRDRVFDVAFSPDSKLIGSGAFDGEVRLWDSYTQELVFSERLHDHQVFCVRFSPNGRWMASCSCVWRSNVRKGITADTPGAIILTDLHTRESTPVRLREEAGVRAIDFLPDGRLVVGDYLGWLWIYDLSLQEIVEQVHVGPGRVDGLCLSADGSLISVSQWLKDTTGKRELHTFGTKGLKRVSKIDKGYNGAWRIAYAPPTVGENLVASGVHFYDVLKGRKVDQWSGPGGGGLTFSPDGRTMAVARRRIRLWNVQAQKEVAAIPAHQGGVVGLTFSPDGTMLASASEDSTIRIWRTQIP